MPNELRWLGHSGWQIRTSKGTRLLIDPWLEGNPAAAVSLQEVDGADYVLITHDHSDHSGDATVLVEQTGATLVGQPEVVARHRSKDPSKQVPEPVQMNIGGTVQLGEIAVTMTDAYHSSETGSPAGYILTLEDGTVVYHMGDTGLHFNMKTWGELFDIDVVLIPIGDTFTMGARQAARAVRWLGAKTAAPMHYKTFPLLAQSADEFVRHCREEAPDTKVIVLEPGETFVVP